MQGIGSWEADLELCQEDIDHIRSSYMHLSVDIQRAGDVFYEKLFEIAPETREMFLQDINVQSSKLMSTLGLVVSQLQNTSELEPVINDLALRHLAYGVKEEHYSLVREALISMLRTVLDKSLPDEVLVAWERAYDSMARVMLDAAYSQKVRA